MKQLRNIGLGLLTLIIVIILICAVYSPFAIKNEPRIKYVQELPGSIMAMTIPPFGIFIEEKYQNEGFLPGTILAHEKIHWLQYQERGLFKFYRQYIRGWLKDGRLYNELEQDARERSAP